ncbi:MAG TPA: hypothetical protein VGG41_03065, partial [Solirubrobacteraceae bacterium]
MRLRLTLALVGASLAALLASLTLAGPAGADGTTLTIPQGATATLSGGAFGPSNSCAVDSLVAGYTLNGGSATQLGTHTQADGCNSVSTVTIGPVMTQTTLRIYLTDNATNCGTTYYSDGTGAADHALVTQESTGSWGVSLADCDIGSAANSARVPANGDGNFNINVAITGPPEYVSGASLSGDAPVGSTMTANPGTWTGSPAPTFNYEWERCDSDSCTDIASADQSSST